MYRGVGLMQVVEILRRWQAGESTHTIAQATGLARNTVGKYLAEARRLGLSRQGAAADDEQILALGRLGQTAPDEWAAPRTALLDPHREQIARWLRDEKLQLTRTAELLLTSGGPPEELHFDGIELLSFYTVPLRHCTNHIPLQE